MKSKNAERLVIREFGHGEPAAYLDDVVKAVELAEEDARERAGKAHCSTCLDNRYPRGCQFQNRLDCSHLTNFIKNYDNEE